jgi:lysophospholipase L1-like esterase
MQTKKRCVCAVCVRTVVLVALAVAGCGCRRPTDRGPLRVLVFDGNSLTSSRGGVPAYPSLITVPPALQTVNVAAIGSTTGDQDRLAATNVDPWLRAGPGLVVMWEGANDPYFGATAAEAIAHLQRYAARRRAVGWTVLLATLLPRADVGLSPNYEWRRQQVNAWLRVGRGRGDGLIDLARDPEMGQAGQERDPRYYLPDRVHLAEAGARRVARIVAAALQAYDPRITAP